MSILNCLKGLLILACLTVSLVLPSCSKKDDPDPVIVTDEDLYINEVYAAGDDWIEIYNKATSAKDISGYKVYDDASNKYTLPAGTSVPANGFVVIYCDDLNTGLHTNFKLTSVGETVLIENVAGEVVDMVTYPELSNGQSYGRYPDGSTTFLVSGSSTQGASNGTGNAPAISTVTRTPLVVLMANSVTIKAEFLSITGIASVKLHYRINSGSFNSVDMSLSNGSYIGTIPALNAEGRVDYYVVATGTAGGTSQDPHSAPDKTHSYMLTDDELPGLVINEFMAFNSACCPDNSSGAEEFDDWIEIYNPTASAINLGGMYFSDDKANPFNHKIPDTNPSLTTIPAGGYLVIWADNDQDQGELHLDFSLSQDGEEIGLYYYDGRPIQEVTFVGQTENTSMARTPNGTGTLAVDATPSPGAAN
jgi:hypothetical protein